MRPQPRLLERPGVSDPLVAALTSGATEPIGAKGVGPFTASANLAPWPPCRYELSNPSLFLWRGAAKLI